MINVKTKIKILLGIFVGAVTTGTGLMVVRGEDIEIQAEQPARYFAQLDENGVVLQVLVAQPDFINSGAVGDPSRWVETWVGGGDRYRYAGIGQKYDSNLNAFIPPKPDPDATFNVQKKDWDVPVEKKNRNALP